MTHSDITLRKVEGIIQEKGRAEDNLAKTNEALMTFVHEMKRIKKVLFAAVGTPEESTALE